VCLLLYLYHYQSYRPCGSIKPISQSHSTTLRIIDGEYTYAQRLCMYSSLCAYAIYLFFRRSVFYLTIWQHWLYSRNVQRLCKIRFFNYDTKTREEDRDKTPPNIIVKAESDKTTKFIHSTSFRFSYDLLYIKLLWKGDSWRRLWEIHENIVISTIQVDYAKSRQTFLLNLKNSN